MMSSGILLVDKPEHLSSAAVVAKVKKKFGYDKIGHGGTLDPFATGLLVLLIGEGTKIARFMLSGEKTYSCEAAIGSETDTGDKTGKITSENHLLPSLADWERTRIQFLGKIQQVPPQYSAIKHQGKALYAYARAGVTIPLEPREVEIFSLDSLTLSPEKNSIRFQVRCSGGTYIRSLMADWARATGTLAHLTALRRLESTPFSLSKAYTLADLLERTPENPPQLLSFSEALAHLPQLHCNQEQATKLRKGQQECLAELEQNHGALMHTSPYFLLFHEQKPLAILAWNNRLILERVFDPTSA